MTRTGRVRAVQGFAGSAWLTAGPVNPEPMNLEPAAGVPSASTAASTMTAFVYILSDRFRRAGHNMTDAPKSAIDIVMERLRRKDAESGTQPQSLTDAQRKA